MQIRIRFSIADQTRFNGCKSQLRVISDIGLWMKSSRLRLNSSKTEVLWAVTSRQLIYFDHRSFVIGSTAVKPNTMARNLGVAMNYDFSMKARIGKLVQSYLYLLRQMQMIIDHSPLMLKGP